MLPYRCILFCASLQQRKEAASNQYVYPANGMKNPSLERRINRLDPNYVILQTTSNDEYQGISSLLLSRRQSAAGSLERVVHFLDKRYVLLCASFSPSNHFISSSFFVSNNFMQPNSHYAVILSKKFFRKSVQAISGSSVISPSLLTSTTPHCFQRA